MSLWESHILAKWCSDTRKKVGHNYFVIGSNRTTRIEECQALFFFCAGKVEREIFYFCLSFYLHSFSVRKESIVASSVFAEILAGKFVLRGLHFFFLATFSLFVSLWVFFCFPSTTTKVHQLINALSLLITKLTSVLCSSTTQKDFVWHLLCWLIWHLSLFF